MKILQKPRDKNLTAHSQRRHPGCEECDQGFEGKAGMIGTEGRHKTCFTVQIAFAGEGR